MEIHEHEAELAGGGVRDAIEGVIASEDFVFFYVIEHLISGDFEDRVQR
jgi:hypothetical protein